MRNFQYFTPKSLEEAMALLSQYGKAKVMAGGTDLIVEMRNRELEPEQVIDLKSIPQMDHFELDKEGLRMGALVRIRDIETSKVIQQNFSILSEAARLLGSVQIRNKATVGGNLCHAAPSADMAPPLIGLCAQVKFLGRAGEKVASLEEFFTGPGQTILRGDEILTEIRVPKMADHTEGVYLKFSPRKAMDLAIVGVASVLTMDTAISTFKDIRIVLGAVAPIPLRAKKAEALLRGGEINDSLIEETAKVASQQAKPISDIRASEEYRRQIVEVLVRRTIHEALEKVKAKERGK